MFGQYYGSSLSLEDCDIRAINKISHKILKQETELFKLKWYDYRHLHPTQSTYLYAHYYREAYKHDTKIYVDKTQARYRKGIIEKDFLDSKERAALWRGRVIADILCMPYDRYIRYAMRYCREQMFWKTTPRPCHLTMEECMTGAKESWEMDLSTKVILPKITAEVVKTRGELYVEIQRFICAQLRKREKPYFGIKHYMLDEKILTEKIALEFFDSDMIDRAKELVF